MSKEARGDHKRRRILLTLVVLGIVGSLAGLGTFSAFSSTTSNSGNVFAAGTVLITDNDAGSALYNVSNAKPGTTSTSCIQVTYQGTLAADVHLYTASGIGALGQYVNLTIQPGTQASPSFSSCAGFSASGGPLYSGTLAAFATAHNNYGNGMTTYPAAQTQWNQNDAVVYQFTVTLQDNNAAQGLTTGSHAFTWEAQNQ
jgi:predicted ribosomally synthesized peptide with SipW-like signal peptide